jgi:hypothetical protein
MIADEPGQRLLYENDRLRIWEEVLPVGEQVARLHHHRYQFMPIVVAGGPAEGFDENGAMEGTWVLEPGSLGWRGTDQVPFAHGGRNAGDTEIRIIVVEDLGALPPN